MSPSQDDQASEVINLAELEAQDDIARMILQKMRDGHGMPVDQAADELRAVGYIPEEKIARSVAVIEQLADEVQKASEPKAVVAGNIESWYTGPREADIAWTELRDGFIAEGWSEQAIKDLDESSTKVVAQLPDPHGEGEYQCRGLVLGYVQSGKTSNFTSVIAKAADAGYRFFIVLAGMHNALRQQTQERLNDQLWEHNKQRWFLLTDEDDFEVRTPADALLGTGDQRVLAVVKKNATRLRNLSKWLFSAQPEYLASCPVLIIDDEADQASVNTGKPDEQPRTINRLIREIVNGIPRSAYVGYTASPFANVLIDPDDYEDLYPRDFIVDLPKPDIYVGPEMIFGRESLEFDGEDAKPDDGFDFVREIASEELPSLRAKGKKDQDTFDPKVTDSLDRAIRYFAMSTAARRFRGKGNPHATALVHTSQRLAQHARMSAVIRAHVEQLGRRVEKQEPSLLSEMRSQWEDECDRIRAEDFNEVTVGWERIQDLLGDILNEIEVVTDNSQSEKRLDFDSDNPKAIIAVGGNTLSRGLTLEGLSVSYFVRSASAYDTLLQMGRWFGYRNGYLDLTRIWMTDGLAEWFRHIATVEREIRYDISRYEADHVSPEELGVRIRTHPQLSVTSAAKMRGAVKAQASYSGRRIQTILFNHHDRDWLLQNIEAGRNLIKETGSRPARTIRRGVSHMGDVSSSRVIQFLREYQFHERSHELDGELISKYIRERMAGDELTRFQVVVMGLPDEDRRLGHLDLASDLQVACINRSRLKSTEGDDYADIKALMSTRDRIIDLDVPDDLSDIDTAHELALMRNAPPRGHGDGSGLLLLYPISKGSKPKYPPGHKKNKVRVDLEAVEHVLGVGMVFPVSESREAAVEYVTVDLRDQGFEVEDPDYEKETDESGISAGGTASN